jgi:hypothetical protein
MGKENDKPCRGGEDCSNKDHLCRIAKREDMELLRQLVRDARFSCHKCGRAAHDEKNLCKPAKL